MEAASLPHALTYLVVGADFQFCPRVELACTKILHNYHTMYEQLLHHIRSISYINAHQRISNIWAIKFFTVVKDFKVKSESMDVIEV